MATILMVDDEHLITDVLEMIIILMSGAQSHLGVARPNLFVNVFDKPFEMQARLLAVKTVLKPGAR